MIRRIILATLCTVLLASSASGDDFDRPGWYVGAGGGVAWDFLSTFIQEQTAKTSIPEASTAEDAASTGNDGADS